MDNNIQNPNEKASLNDNKNKDELNDEKDQIDNNIINNKIKNDNFINNSDIEDQNNKRNHI